MENQLIHTITQGGFGALAIWLIWYTLKESQRREERLQNIIDRYGERIEKMTDAVSRLTNLLAERPCIIKNE